ncbi:uncharacterized protein [Argopecten irradians]|uniref:uncharacterized protein isoform X2 n=1 Tax=Argopecten irradians TaxID=31199 RepID=UPI0037214DC1
MALRLQSVICNPRVIRQFLVFHRTSGCSYIQEALCPFSGHIPCQVRCYRATMEEPSFMLAADSDVDELDLQKVVDKIRRKMKRRFQQKRRDSSECSEVSNVDNVQVDYVLSNFVINCENGTDMETNISDSPAESSQASGNESTKKEKKKRKLSHRLERILNHHTKNKKLKMLNDEKTTEMKPKTDTKCTSLSEVECQNIDEKVTEEHTENVTRDCTEAAGNVTVETGGNVTEETGNATVETGGNTTEEMVGNVTEESGGNVAEEDTRSKQLLPPPELYLALDCEFVGVGFRGSYSRLGRCSIVDFHGNVVYDMYSCPEETITDYRTRYSGITAGHMTNGVPFEVVQKAVKDFLKDRILVGHGIHNDLSVLKIDHPMEMIRDTLKLPCLRKKALESGCERMGLKFLTWYLLKRRIQSRTHCSVEDARATMDLFKLVREEWEESLIHPRSGINTTTQQPKLETNKKEEELSEYLDDKFWPKDHKAEPLDKKEGNKTVDGKVCSSSDNSGVFIPHGSKSKDPILMLNNFAQRMQWSMPEYKCNAQPSGEFVCKVTVSGEEFHSRPCSRKSQAKKQAADLFFSHHRSTSNDFRNRMEQFNNNTKERTSNGEPSGVQRSSRVLH